MSEYGDRRRVLLQKIAELEGQAATPEAWKLVAEGYEEACCLYPGEHKYVVNQGNALWLADRPAESLACFKEALQMEPDSALAYRGLANVLTDLTLRERDVLRAMAEGLTNQQIATILGIGGGTVRVYIHSIFQKLQVTNRTQAVLKLLDQN